MLILVANQKGGVGKSTVAAHAAVRIAMMGHSVALADADPQRTSWHWTRRRARERPDAPYVAGERVGEAIRDDLNGLSERYRHIVVDTPPADTDALYIGLELAHRIIVPTRVADRDLQALPRLAEGLAAVNLRRANAIRARVVFNNIRALPNFWHRIDIAREKAVTMGFNVCQRAIVDRLVYDDSQQDGGTVFDDRWDNKAIAEMNEALRELLRNPPAAGKTTSA